MPSLKQVTQGWKRASARRVTWHYRQMSWRSRALPNLIIIGAQKSGTTSLYSYLSQHPQLQPAFVKEIHFFDGGLDPDVDNFEKGPRWYRAHFPLQKDIRTNEKTFEASPLYMFNPLVPRRISELLPEVRVLALLRNPTERAISHYFHERRKKREPLAMREALQHEETRLEYAIKESDYKSNSYINHSYKSRGLYKEQLERYLTYFPWGQMLVLNSEELFGNPHSTLKLVFEFLEVDSGFKVPNLNPRSVGKNRDDVASDVYDYLNHYFLPHNEDLYRLLGRSYDW